MKDQLLDRLLTSAVARATDPGDLQFTERQLYYEMCRGVQPAHRLPRHRLFTVRPPISYQAYLAALSRREKVQGLLPVAETRSRAVGTNTVESDLFDYGLPRVLICQSQSIASMLRANGIQTESACLVVGSAELPLDPAIAGMLSRADDPAIYVLHESSGAGLNFAARLSELTEVPVNARVIPIGLRPRQAGAMHLIHQIGEIPETVDSADSWETKWLRQGRFVQTAAVRPKSLLRTVHRLVRDVHVRRIPLIDTREARNVGFLTWPTA